MTYLSLKPMSPVTSHSFYQCSDQKHIYTVLTSKLNNVVRLENGAGAIDLVRSWLTAPCVIGQGAAASGVAEQADAGAAGSAAAAAGEGCS